MSTIITAAPLFLSGDVKHNFKEGCSRGHFGQSKAGWELCPAYAQMQQGITPPQQAVEAQKDYQNMFIETSLKKKIKIIAVISFFLALFWLVAEAAHWQRQNTGNKVGWSSACCSGPQV